MKLIEKVVLFVFSTILVAYIIYTNRNKPSVNSKKSLRVPLLKDNIIWNGQPDVIYNKAVQTFNKQKAIAKEKNGHPPLSKKKKNVSNIVRVGPVEDAFLSDKLLRDGLLISFTKTKLQFNIIEENTKALVYWLTMTSTLQLKASGNTLILFSNSLDMSIPPYSQNFPFHRVPRNDKEMLYILQSRGSYLVKAVLTGIINRIIWVWPDWAQKSTSRPYSQQRIAFGISKTRNMVNFCRCQSNRCSIPWANMILTPEQCHSKINIIIDSVQENTLQKKLTEKNWLSSTANVLLHIEGTYFGYVSQTTILATVFPDNNVLYKIDNLANKLFCIHSIQDEIYIDRLMLKAIEYSRINKECLKNNTSKIKTGPFAYCKGVHDQYFKMDDEIYKFLRRKLEGTQYLCKTYSPFVDFLIKELSLSFKQKNINQLGLLKVTGFCLSTTVKAPQKFGMCMGASSFGQNRAFMQSHKPNPKEIKSRLELLRLFLKKISLKSMKTVTFCRCIRQGNAPRFYLYYIESSLLRYFKTVDPHFNLNYDRHILGHKNGWYNRSYLKDTL